MTEAERRGALLVVGLLLLGAAWDAFRGPRREPVRVAPPAPIAARFDSSGEVPSDSAVPLPAAGALDLNQAPAEALEKLPGVGPVLARRIVEHRAQHGPFRHVDELLAVRGIGERLLERLRSRLRVDSR